MIKVTIELISAISKETQKLGEIHIVNDGTGTEHQGNYDIYFYKGVTLNLNKVWKIKKLFSFPRKRLNAFHLLQKALMKL